MLFPQPCQPVVLPSVFHSRNVLLAAPFVRATCQVERAMAKIGEVRTVMVILLVLEGCGLFLAATVYVCMLAQKVRIVAAGERHQCHMWLDIQPNISRSLTGALAC